MPNAVNIASRLTNGQRSAIMSLSDDFCVLGCSEPYVIRLCKQKHGRPALAVEGGRVDGHRTFSLTPLGSEVKKAL